MNLNSLILENQIAIINKLNEIQSNSKRTEEFPEQNPLDATSKIRVTNNNVSEWLDVQKIIDETLTNIPIKETEDISSETVNGVYLQTVNIVGSGTSSNPQWKMGHVYMVSENGITILNQTNLSAFTNDGDGTSPFVTVDNLPPVSINIKDENGITKITGDTFTLKGGVFNPALKVFETGTYTPDNTNTRNGFLSLSSNVTGTANTAIGYQSLRKNTAGIDNTAAGSFSLTKNFSGNYNTAFGAKSSYSNTTGSFNTAIGFYSLYKNTLGIYNTSLGTYSLNNNLTGNFNVGIGAQSLSSNTTGGNNVALGYFASRRGTTSSNNVALGYNALYNNVTGTGNVAIGYKAGFNELGSNKLYIANSNTATPLIYGDFATKKLAFNINNLNLSNIPTVSTGLVAGDVWNNAGVLTIV